LKGLDHLFLKSIIPFSYDDPFLETRSFVGRAVREKMPLRRPKPALLPSNRGHATADPSLPLICPRSLEGPADCTLAPFSPLPTLPSPVPLGGSFKGRNLDKSQFYGNCLLFEEKVRFAPDPTRSPPFTRRRLLSLRMSDSKEEDLCRHRASLESLRKLLIGSLDLGFGLKGIDAPYMQ